jgi:hypothetical protein
LQNSEQVLKSLRSGLGNRPLGRDGQRKTVNEPSTHRPFVFTVIEDDGVNVTIEISEEDYQADLAAGIDEEDTLKPGRYKMRRGGFLARHPELIIGKKERL